MSGPDEALSTERFVLEPIREDHADLLFIDLLDPRLYQFIPGDPPASAEQLRRTYARWSKRRSSDGSEVWYNYALRVIDGSGFVGTLQATLMTTGEAMLAYQVFPRFWRTGIAAECMAAMLTALAAAGVNRFIAYVDTRNLASQRLLEKLSFLKVREIENADFFKGGRSDEFVYEQRPPHAPA